ncbi:MAG: indolepyruvate ferredoxin oxidoreductase, partial [Microvirga sp.]|nr:indolepyruvate ferredoxin oxidoreductase [Microvirga sp.]
ACPWPLSQRELVDFARGLDKVIVVEEKRSLIEVQLREELYGTANQPVCIGKKDEEGSWLFPVKGALDPNDIAIAIGERLLAYHNNDDLRGRVARLRHAQDVLATTGDVATRTPHFCAGCPHNSSTKVPEGMRAYAGIGCHYMVQWMDRSTEGFTQMGGEGANWIGESPFSKRGHVFQNLGDGTYNHSGVLALRWSIHTKTNVTYKILFNDAVAMTGGQKHEGGLTVDMIARQVREEGVERIALVTDEPHKYPKEIRWPAGMTIHHRSELEAVQRQLAEVPGVSVMIYDQTCASEKRRRRKRGEFPDPDKRVIINDLVCEACGDCSVQSNCVAVQPVETEFGRKRQIDQSNCNKDFSCVNGFCPSFVTVHGAKVKKAVPCHRPHLQRHRDGRGRYGCRHHRGDPRHGGASRGQGPRHDRHGRPRPEGRRGLQPCAACQQPGRHPKKVLAAVKEGQTALVVNTAEVMPGEFTRNADFSLPTERLKRAIRSAAGAEGVSFVDATAVATALLGNAIAANMFMLGYAYQTGRVPLSGAAIEKAIELNGEAVKMNLAAFTWGRRAAAEPELIASVIGEMKAPTESRKLSETLDEVIERRVGFLSGYQSRRYARRFSTLVERVRAAEDKAVPGSTVLTDVVARSLFKLMAYKDEYEVARLYTNGHFAKQVASAFEGDNLRYEFHMAPPVLAKKDPVTGLPRKMSFGPWMLKAMGVLAKFKALRGTPLDVFGYTHERRTERQLIREFEGRIEEIVARLNAGNHATAVGLASIPQKIRGFGHIKERNLKAAKAEEADLLAKFRADPQPMAVAAE